MCFSERASMISFFLGLFGAGMMFFYFHDTFTKIVASFLAYVSLMQAVEWGLWRHPICDVIHRCLSVLGMLLNSSQPLVLGALILFFRPHFPLRYLIGWLMFSYALVVVYFMWDYTTGLQCTQSNFNDPHLVWNWTQLPYFEYLYHLTCILISLIGLPHLYQAFIFISVFLVLLVYSKVYYSREAFGSIWCYFTAFVPIVWFVIRWLVSVM